MSRSFKLELTNLVNLETTNDNGLGEIGNKDEIYLFGFGMSRKGHRIIFKPKNLGSFSRSDTKVFSPAIEIGAHEIDDDDNHVVFCLWAYEKDGGYVQNHFDSLSDSFQFNFDRKVSELRAAHYPEPVAHEAFLEILMFLHYKANALSKVDFEADDDIYLPTVFRVSNKNAVAVNGGSHGDIEERFMLYGYQGFGDYNLTFNYNFGNSNTVPGTQQ
jgi:hypothetical protein